MSDGGKGSAPRPFGVDAQTYDTNWDRIFGKKPAPQPKDNDEQRSDERLDVDQK